MENHRSHMSTLLADLSLSVDQTGISQTTLLLFQLRLRLINYRMFVLGVSGIRWPIRGNTLISEPGWTRIKVKAASSKFCRTLPYMHSTDKTYMTLGKQLKQICQRLINSSNLTGVPSTTLI